MPPTHVVRILDASLNRVGEGLRVVEDYVRFALDDPFLASEAKSLRHDFRALAEAIPADQLHAARDTLRDVGTQITHPSEGARGEAQDVCAASFKRAQQSLRSIAEYVKLIDAALAAKAEALRYRLYTLEKAVGIEVTSRHILKDVTLCVLLDGSRSIDAFETLARQLIEAGVGMIQLRDKGLDDRDLVTRARLLVSLTRRQSPAPSGVTSERRTLAIINDRPDIATAVHADGVHLGQEDLSVKDARAVVGTQLLIGVSTHNIEQARLAVLDGANYLGAGPTFPSQTKSFDRFAGVDYLRQVAAEIRLPTFAIGGISAENVAQVIDVGIARVAVSSAVAAADKPASAARQLLDMLTANSLQQPVQTAKVHT